MLKYRDDFPDLNPLLLPQMCNKCQYMLKIHSVDHINKELNLIITIVIQIKGILTRTVFSVHHKTFTLHLYHLHTTHILDFVPKFRPLQYPNNKLQILHSFINPLSAQNGC